MKENNKGGGWTKERLFNIIKNTLGTILFIIIIVLVFENLGTWGLLGLFGFFLVFALWRLWKYRDFFMSTLRSIEVIIWKKPLDRELWAKGELKNTKVKINWGKKKNEKTNKRRTEKKKRTTKNI